VKVQRERSPHATLPDGDAFARLLPGIATADLRTASPACEWIFFDRGLVDAAVALARTTSQALAAEQPLLGSHHRTVFVVAVGRRSMPPKTNAGTASKWLWPSTRNWWVLIKRSAIPSPNCPGLASWAERTSSFGRLPRLGNALQAEARGAGDLVKSLRLD
jgi:hypothetical protein